MSLYNMLHGVNPLAGGLLEVLGFQPQQFVRIRNVYLVEVDNDLRIAVFTRCGGGNRDDHEHVFSWARDQPTYLRDFDDDYDSTFATFEFAIPETEDGQSLREQIAALTVEQRLVAIQSKSFRERSQEVLDSITSDK